MTTRKQRRRYPTNSADDAVTQAALDAKRDEAIEEPPPESEEELFPGADEQAAAEEKLNAILEAKAAQAANKVLATLPQAIEAAVEKRVNAIRDETNAKLDEIKQAIIGNPVHPQGQTTVQPGMQLAQTGNPNSLSEIVSLLQVIAGAGGKPKDNGLESTMQTLTAVMNMAEAVYMRPRESAMKDVIALLKGGYAVGKDTQELAEGLERVSKQPPAVSTDIFKARPSA